MPLRHAIVGSKEDEGGESQNYTTSGLGGGGGVGMAVWSCAFLSLPIVLDE